MVDAEEDWSAGYSSMTERMLPSGSFSQALFTSPTWAMPFSSVLIGSVSYCSKPTPLATSSSTVR